MVTKIKTAAPAVPAVPAAKRRAPRKPVSAAAEAGATPTGPPGTDAATEPGKANLLRAGLKALGNVRDDVVQHQSRVFEAILGIDPAQAWSGLVRRDAVPPKSAGATKAATEAFGLRKFEAVFDQRVASALERMGMPSAETLKALTDEVAALKKELHSLKAARKR